MKARGVIKPTDFAIAGGVLAASALLFGVVLAAWSSPTNFADRLAAVEGKAERAQSLMRPPRIPSRFGADAVCTQDPEAQAQALRDGLNARTTENSLVLVSADVRPEPAADLAARLVPVRVRFTATGSYEGAVALLAVLARETPQIFVDSLDLVPRTANVSLTVSGRVFCAA